MLYATVDRYDNKQYRELYGTPEAVKAAREDKPIPRITVAQSQERSAVLLKGQSHTQAFVTAGVYEYSCGLHPGMKGSVEVK